jgi:nitrous oxidase accessory protein NosD
LNRKGLAVGLILLLIETSVIQITAQDTEKPLPTSRGDWLYVGGSGPGNYTRIQDAIDNAIEGDTIFVYHGMYYEHDLVISKLNLIGEDRNITIIDGHDAFQLGILVGDGATVRGFTIRGFTQFNSGIGISINGNKVTISDNVITGCSPYGIYIGTTWLGNESNVCSIHDNYFISNTDALTVRGGSRLVSIDHNQFENNNKGICTRSTRATISCNNFINNSGHIALLWETIFLTLPFVLYRKPSFSENYWDDWSGEGPQIIHGYLYFWIHLPSMSIRIPLFPIVQFDWHPAQEPYDIPGRS